MKRALLALFALAALVLGGCPTVSSNPTTGRQTGTTTGTGGSHTSSGGATTGGTSGTTASCTRPLEQDYWRGEVLRLVNVERTSRGLQAVKWNATLETEATEYACEMIEYDYFAHVNPVTGSTLSDRAAAMHYDYWMLGENLAAGQPGPAKVMQDWMNSPDHRENILNPGFTELGVGVMTGGEHDIYWVQEFGRPVSAGAYSE